MKNNKEKKRISKSLIISLIVIVAAAALIMVYMNGEETIGGERDEFGCLSAGGYSFDTEIGACTKAWEIKEENDKKAAKAAVDSLAEEGLTIVELKEARCTGCYLVKVEKDSVLKDIVLSNWKARTRELSADECFAFGAKLVKESEGCSEEETNFGSVISFDDPKICCVA